MSLVRIKLRTIVVYETRTGHRVETVPLDDDETRFIMRRANRVLYLVRCRPRRRSSAR